MEKTSIVTKRETKISEMEVNRTEQTETGVRRNITSEVVIESSVIKIEIVTENIGCRKSKISEDASVDRNNVKFETRLKVPWPNISGGDFARIGEVASTGASGMDGRETVANDIDSRAAVASGIDGRTAVVNGASGECRSSSVRSKNDYENRKICKKRKTHDGNSEVFIDSFVLRDAQHRRPPIYGNLRWRSAPLKDRLETVTNSQACGQEDRKAANISCTNKVLCSLDSASAMKTADELTLEASSPKRTKETEKVKDYPQTGEVFVSSENAAVDSINVPSSSKEVNGSCIKEDSHRKSKVTLFNRSCKKELIRNLEKSVTDLVNYFENLQQSSLERNSLKLADDKSEKSICAAKKRPRTENKNPEGSVSTLPLMGRQNKHTGSGSREKLTKAHKSKMLDGSSQIVDLPCVANNNLKQHLPNERTFVFPDQAPTLLPPKKDIVKDKSAFSKVDKHITTVGSRIPIIYFGIIVFIVFAASLNFVLTFT